MIGSRLGPYEITAKLGEGGMGEVYRATDTRLKRDVAIKVLPAAFTEDKERLARFEREAQLLAQLHHPNIASIFGLEESGGTRALVMELVEGSTLAERLEQGPLPFNESLSVAVQIAQALEEAHEKGIIHRDLKPQNIKASIEGKVKVLDFGLAKAMDPVGAASGGATASQLALSPTMTLGATVQGMILGTAAYMAPEQAAGGAVDRRADIWAFGVVLYEMLSGRRLFEGETVSHVLAGVLKDEPDFSALPRSTPPRLLWLVRRCLRKKPRERLQAIGDARLILEELLADPQELRGEDGISPTSAALAGSPRRRLPWIAAAALLALAVALGVVLARRPAPVAEPIRFELPAPVGTEFQLTFSSPGAVTISPDGRQLAFSARDDQGRVALWVRSLAESTPRSVAGTEGAQYPFWSPDSKRLGFGAEGKLKSVDLAGGPATTLCAARDLKGASWSRNGSIVFAPEPAGPLHVIAASGGGSRPVTTLDDARGDITHRHPRFLPDGERFLYLARSGVRRAEGHAIVVGSLKGGLAKELVRSPGQAEIASGRLLYLRGQTLVTHPFDLGALEPRGEPTPLVEGVALLNGASLAIFSAGREALAFGRGLTRLQLRQLRWRGRGGAELDSVEEPAAMSHVELAPAGDTAVVRVREDESTNRDLWLVDFARGLRSRFTFDVSSEIAPAFSPDGDSVVWTALGGDGRESTLMRKALSGSAVETAVAKFPTLTAVSDWHPSGGPWIAAQEEMPSGDDAPHVSKERFVERARSWDIVLIDPSTGELKPWLATPHLEVMAQFSPDGRWVVYVSDESGHDEIYVTPFPGPGRKWQISTKGGGWPRWRADGQEIIYRDPENVLNAVTVVAQDGGKQLGFSPPLSLFRHDALEYSHTYDVSPDGQRFLVIDDLPSESPGPLTVMLNWSNREGAR